MHTLPPPVLKLTKPGLDQHLTLCMTCVCVCRRGQGASGGSAGSQVFSLEVLRAIPGALPGKPSTSERRRGEHRGPQA